METKDTTKTHGCSMQLMRQQSNRFLVTPSLINLCLARNMIHSNSCIRTIQHVLVRFIHCLIFLLALCYRRFVISLISVGRRHMCGIERKKATSGGEPKGSSSPNPASILHKSTARRLRPVSYPDGPLTARCRFMKNAYWERSDLATSLEIQVQLTPHLHAVTTVVLRLLLLTSTLQIIRPESSSYVRHLLQLLNE